MVGFLCSSILWLLDSSIYQFIQCEDGFHKPKMSTEKSECHCDNTSERVLKSVYNNGKDEDGAFPRNIMG